MAASLKLEQCTMTGNTKSSMLVFGGTVAALVGCETSGNIEQHGLQYSKVATEVNQTECKIK
jgi:hypothetical protein